MGILSVRRWWLDDFERTILPTAQFKNYEIETKSLIRFGGKCKIGRVDERFLYLSNVNMNAGGASFGYETNIADRA